MMSQIARLIAFVFRASYTKGFMLLACLAGPVSATPPDGETSPNVLESQQPVTEDAVTKVVIERLSIPKGKNIDPKFVMEVFSEICRLGIREPQIVMRQAMLETGWLRAPLLMKRNNLFGFRYQTYLSFPHWKDSVRYYRDWQGRRYKESDASYYAFLTRIRYGVPSYVQHVKKIRWNSDCDLVLEKNLPSAVPTPDPLGDPQMLSP